jgi:sugar phosphate isomerase/epimerase
MSQFATSGLTRRGFLKASAAAAGATLMQPRSQARAAPADPYGGFKVGLQSYSLRAFDFQTALAHTQRLGLKHWEAFSRHIPLNTLPEHIREHKALLDGAGVTLLAYGVVGFDGDETKAREVFDFAKAMGLVSISADPRKDGATFDLLDKLVAEYGIPIAIHNHGPGHRYDKVQDVVEVVKDRHPLIGACVDTGHYIRSDEDPVEVIEKLGPRVFGVHFKDARTVRDAAEIERLSKVLPQNRVRQLEKEGKVFTILGEGELNVLGCLKALRALNYQRSVSLEYEESEQNPLSDIEQCLKSVREAVQKLPPAT